ncbi:MAG: hypothetical protein K5753_02665 [Clostridia bacterium]|nr:hypothetical protein [Clostridia bacterium]
MSLRARIKRSPFEMCFVYDGIHSMDELEDLDPIASYYVCFEDSTCFFLSETPYGNDALRYFDYDVDNGAVSPFSVGEVCYFVYERFIQLSEEPNGEGSENVVTFSFNRKGEKQIVFGYEGEYSSAADLPERFHLEGTWSMEGSILTWVGFDDRIAYYQPNEKDPEDLVLRPYFGELCYLLYDPSEDQTLGFFDKFGENTAYSFQGEISEENMDSVTGGGIGKWTYDADAKMLGAGAGSYYFRYYFYQDEGGNWNPIVESSESALTISFYSYEYRYDDNKNSWSTITYLFAKDLETHAQPIYEFVREGILAPLTYAECKAVLEDPNSVNGEDYYHSNEYAWDSSGEVIYTITGTTFYIGLDFGVSFFGEWYVFEEGGVEYLLIRQSYNNFYVYTFEDYTAAQILHMKPDTAMSFLSESNAFVAKRWGERYIRIHNDETDRTDILSITGHTVAPMGIDNLFCSGSFTRSGADGDKDCTAAFCKREEGVIFVFITEGTYGFDELDGLDFEFFGEAYEFPFEENVYSVYADERNYGFEFNGTVATYVDLGGGMIIL